MLFQMLAGVLPFRGESMAELMFKIANEPAPDIRAFRPEVPASLARVMEKAMAKSLEVRYTSGGQLAADLRACMGDIPSGGGHSSALDQVQYPAALTAPMDMTQPMDTEAFATTVMMDDVVDTTMDATGMGQGRGHAS
jgi:serine/threonine-protein kinase